MLPFYHFISKKSISAVAAPVNKKRARGYNGFMALRGFGFRKVREGDMKNFSEDYTLNVERVGQELSVSDNFDIIERRILGFGGELTLFFVDGFAKDAEMQKLMQFFGGQSECHGAEDFIKRLPYIEADICKSPTEFIHGVLSGQCGILSDSFPDRAVLLDVRTYPSRSVGEPDSDRVMQGAHDGFVETLITNTALLRRRIRDPRLTMRHFNIGGSSGTDVVLCYMRGVADENYVNIVAEKLGRIKPKSLTLGSQSLSESLIRTGWWNPFPKIRTTERPDTGAAQVLEGSILVICDTSPQVMILPTSLPYYLQQTDDYYFPPLTGTYLRLVRSFILILSVLITPLWYLLVENAELLPPVLFFLIPDSPGAIPLILQLFLTEIAIDGLKIASMNTPDMLSNSLSVVSALILGDFAVNVGWICEDVILYMAFVAIANFAQQNRELGYAFKFFRMIILALVYLFGLPGFIGGIVLFCIAAASNSTVIGPHSYLYPILPFNGKALARLIFRTKKADFREEVSPPDSNVQTPEKK